MYDKTKVFYKNVCEKMWEGAQVVYQCARRHGLNVSENMDADLKTEYTRDELIGMKEYLVPEGYSRHMTGNNLREKYHNGYWLREKAYADICRCEKLDSKVMDGYYYTGNYQKLADYIDACMAAK